jgi:nucleotide sugar dehydrogenase
MIHVTVVGAGKMGLPIACQIASRGAHVTACDINESLVATINRGECPFDEPGLAELLQAAVADGRMVATTDLSAAAATSDVVIVIVPVLVTADRTADLGHMRTVSKTIGRSMKPGTIVIYETTLPVGGTRSLLPLLEAGGLRAGVDFDLVFSPERVKSRLVLKHLSTTPKVVGGHTQGAAVRAAAFYRDHLQSPVIDVGSLEAAELAKLAGMVYRDVNIALANELSRYAELVGVDFGAVAAAANTDGEAALLLPGIGVGGHCTPVYPYFLAKDAADRGLDAELTTAARRINDTQPQAALRRLEAQWQPLSGRSVLLLGLGFRPDVKEHTCSPAFQLRSALSERNAIVRLHDPLYSPAEITGHGFTPGDIGAPEAPEVLVLVTAHRAYRELDFAALAARGLKAVVDGRNVWDPAKVRAAGLVYIGIGRPSASEGGGAVVPALAPIPIAKPTLGQEEAAAARRAILSGWITQGPEVSAFEREFARFVGADRACAVSNCTTALHLALMVAGVGAGDDVVTVSHSYIATANSILYCGATPVFVDVDPVTYNMDPALVEAAITPRTKAILCVHQIGMPCDLSRLVPLARKHGIPLIEDAACAVGSEVLWQSQWERIGKPHGDVACFSFHPRKVISTGDGGMLTTRHAAWDREFRLLRQHAMSVPDTVRHGANQVIFESYQQLGYNYRMTDIQAAVGREQLQRLPRIVAERRALASAYDDLLRDAPGFRTPVQPEWARSNWQSYAVTLPAQADQRQVMQMLLDAGISTRRGIMCSHREPAFADAPLRFALPHSEAAQDRTVLLPLFPGLSVDAQRRIVAALREACQVSRDGSAASKQRPQPTAATR